MGLILNGSSQFGAIALSTSFPAKPYSVAIWCRNDNVTVPLATTEYMFSAHDDIESGDEAIGGSFRAASSLGVLDEGQTAYTIPVTGNAYASDTWSLCLFIYTSATDRTAVLNGDWANRGTIATDVGAEIAWDDITLGAYQGSPGGSQSFHWDGALAGFCVWDVALTETNSNSLWNAGTPIAPNTVRAVDVIQYNELLTDGTATTGDNATITGSPTYSAVDHPYTAAVNSGIMSAHRGIVRGVARGVF